MRLEEVNPRRWSNVRILFDDGEHGIVSGHYDGEARRVLGLRYNGEEHELGYPNARGYPTFFYFFALPELELALLAALEKIVAADAELSHKYGEALREERAVFQRQQVQEIEARVRTQMEPQFQEEVARRIQEELRKTSAGEH